MDAREIAIRRHLRDDFTHYANKCLKIRTKAGEILPFTLNKAQSHVHQLVEHQKLTTGKVRALVLKGRQQGISTYIEGRIYWLVTHRRGVRAFILTHDAEATNNLFEMSQRYHQYCPLIVKPESSASSSKELLFGELDSGYKVGTAGNKAVGRSATIQFLHGSEVAFWPNAIEHSKGVLQAVPHDVGTEIFLESTANGVGNYFHEQWQLAESQSSDFLPIFIPWFWQDEYRRDLTEDFTPTYEEVDLIQQYQLDPFQLMWRRYKIQELSASGANGSRAFDQEYPNNSIVAFNLSGDDTYISPELVMRARKNTCEAVGPLIIGVDPARFGDDRTSIIFRRGRVAYNLLSYVKKDTMEVTGIIYKLIKDHQPDKICIDVGGLGAGIVDRLRELVSENLIISVNAGSTALDQDLYLNKRSEMWGELKKWLEDHPCSIPDRDTLHADLCGIKYNFDSLSRLKMEPKEMMKKRGLRSPDEADALCLTFAVPFSTIQQNKNDAESIADSLMKKSQTLAYLRSRR